MSSNNNNSSTEDTSSSVQGSHTTPLPPSGTNSSSAARINLAARVSQPTPSSSRSNNEDAREPRSLSSVNGNISQGPPAVRQPSVLTSPVTSPMIDPAHLSRLRAIHQRAVALSSVARSNVAANDPAVASVATHSSTNPVLQSNVGEGSMPPLQALLPQAATANHNRSEVNHDTDEVKHSSIDHNSEVFVAVGMNEVRETSIPATGVSNNDIRNDLQLVNGLDDQPNRHIPMQPRYEPNGSNVNRLQYGQVLGNAYSNSMPPSMPINYRCEMLVEDLLNIHVLDPGAVRGTLHGRIYIDDICPYCEVRVRYHARRDEDQGVPGVNNASHLPVSGNRHPMPRPNLRTQYNTPVSSPSAIEGPVAMSAMSGEGSSMRSGDGFLKLKSLLPVWREGTRKTCVEFLRELTELLSTTNYPESQWYKVFPLVVEEGYNRTWVHKNIVSKFPSAILWKEACSIFRSHFESTDYTEKLWVKWQSIRFEHGESVQHFSDRFRVMLEELDLSPSDTVVMKHFLKTLPSNIRQHYDNFCLNRELDEGEPYVPADVDKIIAICVRIEVNIKNRSHSYAGASSTSSGYRSHSSSHSSYQSNGRGQTSNAYRSASGASSAHTKKCPVHPQGNHSWSECRQNAQNVNYNKSRSTSHAVVKKEDSSHRASSQSQHSKPSYSSHGNKSSGNNANKGPAINTATVKCYKCNKMGHYANKCTSPATATNGLNKSSTSVKVIQVVESDVKELDDQVLTSSADASAEVLDMKEANTNVEQLEEADTLVIAPVKSNPLSSLSGSQLLGKGTISIVLQGRKYPVLADSGADLSVMDKVLADELNLPRVPSKGKLDLAVVNIQASREYRTTTLRYQVEFDSKLDEYKMPPRIYEGAFEILTFPPSSEYPIIIGKDLLPSLFDKAIPLCFVNPPPSFVEPHKLVKYSGASIGLASMGELSSETDLELDEQEVSKPTEADWPSPVIATAIGMPEVEQDSADDQGLPDEQDIERAPAVFTMPNLEDEYAEPRAQLMSDPELVEALEVNSRLTGFCTHPDSELKLVIKPFEDGVVPKKLCRPQYRIAERVRHLVRDCINRWFSEGKIIKAPPGIPYNNPIVVAPKKDSAGNVTLDEVRVCLDFRGLNECMDSQHMDQFQLPFIRDTIDKFNGCKIFGEFDLAEAFYQLKLHEESRPYTAFTFEGQQYMCAGVPFGLSIVPSHFQRVISTIMHGLDFTFPYMDNLPFGSKDWETHRQQALTVINLMTRFNLKIKPSSVKLGHSHMRCLGHFVSVKGIGIDPKKLSMVPDWPRPTTGKELMSFLGFVTFIRDHIRHVADLTGPLEAVKNNKTLEWNDTLEEAFRLTKQAVAKAPFLQYPDYTRPFHIATDASNTGVGGVLFQPKEQDEYITADNIVAICSKKLQPCQTRWSAYKKEYYGILYSLRQFRPYVWGRNDLVVYTDHKPLTFVLTSPSLSNVVHGWFDEMSEYNFKIIHRPGILNVVPDALSRMYAASYADTWGVSNGFDMSNITLVDAAPGDIAPRDVTGPVPKQEEVKVSIAPVSVPMGEGAADTSAEAKQAEQSYDFDLQLELEKRGMTMPKSEAERKALVEAEHAVGHFGIDAIYKGLHAKHIWWPGMRKTITSVVQDCHACNVFTVTKKGYNPSNFIHASGPWEHVQVDTSVHMPPSPDGHTTLLIVIDVFTGFVLLRACKSSTAEEIAYELWDIFCTFGFPKILQSDNGHEFVNDTLRALVKISGLEHRFISPYNPRADGKVERAIGTIVQVLKKMVHGSNRLWPLYTPFSQYAFNIKIANLPGSMPFALMFGRAPNEWKDYTKDPPEAIPYDMSSEERLVKWKEHQDKMVALLLPAISRRILQSKHEMIAKLNKKRKALIPKTVAEGTDVYLVDPVKANKWQPKYIGPYTIVRRAHNGAYVLKDSTGDILDRHVPIDQIKILSSKEAKTLVNAPRTETSADQEDQKQASTDSNELLQQQDEEPVAYAVESILKHKGDNPSNYQFLVKWVGYPHSENTWEPMSNFQDREIITKYFKRLEKEKSSSSSSSTSSSSSSSKRPSKKARLN